MISMQSVRIVYWQEDDGWLGYLEEYPDCWTQGETLDDLEEHLKDLYQDLTSGAIHPRSQEGRSIPAMDRRDVPVLDHGVVRVNRVGASPPQ